VRPLYRKEDAVNKLTLILFLTLAFGSTSLFSQELPRPSMARHETIGSLPSDYNLKLGPVLMSVNATLSGEYVDNVALTNSGTKSDFIISPQLGVTASWPVTTENTLRLSTSIGYSKYLIHPQYDTGNVLIAPDSVLSFDIYVGDFKINLHDEFSYQQDPSTVGSISNVVNFNRFQNIAGVGVIWDLNKLVLTFNYDHITFISDSLQSVDGTDLSNPGNINYEADQVSASAAYSVTSTVIVGGEVAASMRYYDDYDINDTGLSVGPFVRVEVTPNFKVSASAGYQEISTESGNLTAAEASIPNNVTPSLGVGTQNSYYANLTLDHRLNKYYTDRLSGGHELELDVFSQVSDVTYVSYTSSWKVNHDLNLAFNINYQDVSSPSTSNIADSNYDLFSAGVQASFPVTKSISGAVLYQFYDKFNSPSVNDYQQNRVGLILNYRF